MKKRKVFRRRLPIFRQTDAELRKKNREYRY